MTTSLPPIAIAENCGLCAGARQSVRLAEAALAEAKRTGRTVVLHRELLHNGAVMASLRDKGALCLDRLEDIPDGAVVVVRAHGEGKDFHDRLAARRLECRDGTCPNVRKIHHLAARGRAEGKAVVILGKHGHPEVEGIVGWCGGEATVLEFPADVGAMPRPAEPEILALCQTTIGEEQAATLLALLRDRFPDLPVRPENTICPAPLAIQRPARELAARRDILFVIGGARSANTRELWEQCRRVGVAQCPEPVDSCQSFYAALRENPALLVPGKTYGFAAGASTPREEVEKCRDLLAFLLYATATRRRLAEKMADLNRRLGLGDNPILRQAGADFADLNQGGKYLRGVLANLGHQLASGRPGEYPDQLSLAFELFQTAVLIHDDLIDHARTRRGRPTLHRRFRERYLPRLAGGADSTESSRLLDEAAAGAAICVGDWGLYAPVSLLAEGYGGSPQLGGVMRAFAEVVEKTIAGELLDVVVSFEERTAENPAGDVGTEAGVDAEADGGAGADGPLTRAVREVYHLKTAWYTVIGPLTCGMLLAGAGEAERGAMREFADCLGTAFQIGDDILGVFGEEAVVGKDVGSDIAEYKQTILYAYVRERKPEWLTRLREHYGREETGREDVEAVRGIFKESGAYAAALGEMRRYFAQAETLLAEMDFLAGPDRELLRGLVRYLDLREK